MITITNNNHERGYKLSDVIKRGYRLDNTNKNTRGKQP